MECTAAAGRPCTGRLIDSRSHAHAWIRSAALRIGPCRSAIKFRPLLPRAGQGWATAETRHQQRADPPQVPVSQTSTTRARDDAAEDAVDLPAVLDRVERLTVELEAAHTYSDKVRTRIWLGRGER